ncbi:MAG: hypothetical protein AMXMBFR34_37080 [Myxococcaceae bacterium]
MKDVLRQTAETLRQALAARLVPPAEFRSALLAVPPTERDAWLDVVFDLHDVAEDGALLPRGCVPYLPTAVDDVLRAMELAQVGPGDVILDVGSGLGRAALLMQLLTGAVTIGIEIQPALAQASRRLAARVHGSRFAVVEGDAAEPSPHLVLGNVFFLYCPFGGARLTRLLGRLEALSRARPIRVCCVDLPLPGCPWLEPVSFDGGALAVYRSARASTAAATS